MSPKYRKVWIPVKWKRGWKRVPQRALRLKALDQAISLIGIMESGGNNNGPRVMQIIRANGGTGPEPWCGDFCAYAYLKAGSKSVTRSWASVRMLRRIAGLKVVSHPLPGDLIVYTFDHVGIFERFDGNNNVVAIEGNTGASGAVSDSKTGGDGVYRKRRSRQLVSHYIRVTR